MARVLELSKNLLFGGGSILYLDHWAAGPEDGRLRSTDALLEYGWSPDRCFCANPDAEIVAALLRRGVQAQQLSFAEALQGPWADEDIGAVYADFCYGSAAKICADLGSLLDRPGRARPQVLVYTMTRRGEGMLHERLNIVSRFLGDRGYRFAGDNPLAPEQMTFEPSAVVTTFCVLVV